MRTITVVVLCGLIALCSGYVILGDRYQNADPEFLEKQKTILEILHHVNQPELQPKYYQDGISYNIQDNLEMYENVEAVREFLKFYQMNLLDKNEIFSIMNQRHRDYAVALFHIFYYAKDWDTFYKTMVWANVNVNKGAYIYALTVSVLHRRDMIGMELPAPYELYPYYFFNADVIQKAKQIKDQGLSGIKQVEGVYRIVVQSNFTDEYYVQNPEQKISYFTEDIGLNTYYYYFHCDYPFWMGGKEYDLYKDRRGELYLFQHQQLLARYFLERLSNDLGDIEELSYRKPVKNGYYPKLRYYNGMFFPTRENNYNFYTEANYYDVMMLEDYERRIRDAIDYGYVILPDGRQIDLTRPESVDLLGNIIQGNPDQPLPRYFKYIGVFARLLLGGNIEAVKQGQVIPSVLEHYETAMRDPVFYSLYKRLIKYYWRFMEHLPTYTRDELDFSGIKIESASVDKLITYFDKYDADITNAVDVEYPGYYQPSFEQPGQVYGQYKPGMVYEPLQKKQVYGEEYQPFPEYQQTRKPGQYYGTYKQPQYYEQYQPSSYEPTSKSGPYYGLYKQPEYYEQYQPGYYQQTMKKGQFYGQEQMYAPSYDYQKYGVQKPTRFSEEEKDSSQETYDTKRGMNTLEQGQIYEGVKRYPGMMMTRKRRDLTSMEMMRPSTLYVNPLLTRGQVGLKYEPIYGRYESYFGAPAGEYKGYVSGTYRPYGKTGEYQGQFVTPGKVGGYQGTYGPYGKQGSYQGYYPMGLGRVGYYGGEYGYDQYSGVHTATKRQTVPTMSAMGKLPIENFVVYARQNRLNHLPFNVKLNVLSDKAVTSVVRIFLGPKYDQYGNLYDINVNRKNFFLLDAFKYDLVPGKNVILRNSREFTWFIRDRTPYLELYKWVMGAKRGVTNFPLDLTEAHCGFPDRLMLPKGKVAGMPFQLYFIITPYIAPRLPQGSTYNYILNCGVGSGSRYIDDLPFGYPFDRVIDEKTWYTPNMYNLDVMIYHKPTGKPFESMYQEQIYGQQYQPLVQYESGVKQQLYPYGEQYKVGEKYVSKVAEPQKAYYIKVKTEYTY